MSIEITILVLVIVAFVGAAITYLGFAIPLRTRAFNAERRITELNVEAGNERSVRELLAVEKAKAEASADRVPPLELTIAELRERIEVANKQAAEAKTILETERKSHDARVEELEKMGTEIERKFRSARIRGAGKEQQEPLGTYERAI